MITLSPLNLIMLEELSLSKFLVEMHFGRLFLFKAKFQQTLIIIEES